jgi:broad specificity phosphatase PhoE
MKILCLRHGQSEYNLLGWCNGDPARGVRLTALGREQARRAGERLRGVPIERAFCSALSRTRETAEIALAGRGIPLETEPAFNDIRSGCEDRPVSEYFAAIGRDRLHGRVGDGETVLEHKARVLTGLERLRRLDCGTLLVVAHEETLRAFAAGALGLDDWAMLGLGFGNCEILELDLD